MVAIARRSRIPGMIDPSALGDRYTPLVIADGAAMLLKLDESGSTAADASGNGHVGTITSATQSPNGGPGGRAYLSFGGSGYVTVPYWSALNTTTGPFTAEIWFRCTVDPGVNTGVFYRNAGAAPETWGMDVRPSRVLETYYYNGSTYPEYVSGSSTWPLSTWNHFVFVKAASSGVGTIYLNGTSLGTVTAGAVVSNTSAGIVIGAMSASTKRFTGDLALAAWYPTALSGAQIAAHYAAI